MAVERSRGGSMRQSQASQQYQYQKPLGEKVKDCCRSTIAFIFSNVGVCILMVGYTLMGALLFSKIEAEAADKQEIINADEVRNRTIEKLWQITMDYNVLDKYNWNSTVSQIVCEYQKTVLELHSNGWDGENDTPVNKWTGQGAFLYSLTVITTIGYGHIAPKTENGKLMTIFYTIFGMPVFLLYMANMGDILAKSLKWTYAKICICRRPESKFDVSAVWRSADATLRAPAGTSQFPPDQERVGGFPGGEEISVGTGSWSAEQPEKLDISSVNIPITVSLVIMALLLYGGTVLFKEYEHWNFLESLYFCFISLTTIGLGDYVPGKTTSHQSEAKIDMSFVYCSIYLMSGLALLSMCFNLMQEEVVHKVTACLNAIKFHKRKDAD